MIVPYEQIPIPEARVSTASWRVGQFLGCLFRLEQPAFILRCASDAEGLETIRSIRAITRAAGGMVNKFGVVAGMREFGWHADHRPKHDAFDFVVHHTTTGAVQARLLPSLPAFWSEVAPVNKHVPREVTEILEQGHVDNRFFEPKMYMGELAANDILVFGISGPRPSIHDFVNTEQPRVSRIYEGVIPLVG